MYFLFYGPKWRKGVSKGRVKDNHNISEMLPIYVTENGERARNGYWSELLKSHCPTLTFLPVVMHIASDTITAVHDMISADVFIGSRSGLSAHIVGNLARGIVLLPNDEGSPIGGGTQGRNLKYSWNRNSSSAIFKRDKLDEKISKFVQQYDYELPLMVGKLDGRTK